MSTPNDISGPAFPIPGETWESEGVQYGSNPHYGMTMRDYFAAKAMAAILGHLDHGIRPQDCIVMVEDAYTVADAMLKARGQ